MYNLDIEELTFLEMYELSANPNLRCFVVFDMDNLKKRYPLPSFDNLVSFTKWVYEGRLSFSEGGVNSETYDVFSASYIHIYPR